jgi:hypothetical protein
MTIARLIPRKYRSTAHPFHPREPASLKVRRPHPTVLLSTSALQAHPA